MTRESKKRKTRARLVEAALACFSEKGYEKATVDEITRRAGLAKGTFFNYFQTKSDVLLSVGEIQEEWMLEQIQSIHAEDDTPLAPRIIDLWAAAAARLPLSRPLVRAMFQATLRTPEVSDAQVRHFARVGEALVPICEQGQAKGELTSDFSARTIAGLIMQAYSSALLTWSLTSKGESLEMIVRITFAGLFNGLIARK